MKNLERLCVASLLFLMGCSQKARRESEAQLGLTKKSLVSCRFEALSKQKFCAEKILKAGQQAIQSSAELGAIKVKLSADCICRAPKPKLQDSVFVVHSSTGAISTGFLVEMQGVVYGVTTFHSVSLDSTVLIERQLRSRNGFRRVSQRAKVAYVCPEHDLAILTFPKNVPVSKLIGPPLPLATLLELRSATGKVVVIGVTADPNNAGTLTSIHQVEGTITKPYHLLRPICAFTNRRLSQNSPKGFSIAPGVFPGFSGSPVFKTIGSFNKVVGMAITLVVARRTGQSASIVVGAADIRKAVNRAVTLLRRKALTRPLDIKPQCEASLNKIVMALRAIQFVKPSKLPMALAQNQPLLKDFNGNLYRHVSPASRRLLSSPSSVRRLIAAAISQSHAKKISEPLKRLPESRPTVIEAPVCQATMLFLFKLGGFVRSVNLIYETALRNIPSRVRDLTHWLHVTRLSHSFPGDAIRKGSKYGVALKNGRLITGIHDGEVSKFVRFDMHDSTKKSRQKLLSIDFIRQQGRCLLVLSRLQKHARIR